MGLLSKLNLFARTDDPGTMVTVDELQGMIDRHEDITIIDVRNTARFGCEHIAGAVNIPLKLIRKFEDVIIGVLEHGNRLVVCCESGDECWAARDVLLTRGAKDVVCLKGGMKEWVRSGRMLISD